MADPRVSAAPVAAASADEPDAESSTRLLARARSGDRAAVETLFERAVPVLQRWASGRLPRWARDATETADLVQETVLHTLRHIDSFEPSRGGALQAYLRQAVMNRIRDEIRKAGRRPRAQELGDHESDDTSPLEQAIGRDALTRYEASLQRLRPEDREAIVGRLELGYDYDELAAELDKPTPGAARAAVGRAMLRLAEEMRDGR